MKPLIAQSQWNGRFYNILPTNHVITEGSIGMFVLARLDSEKPDHYIPLAFGQSEDLAGDLNPLIEYLIDLNLNPHKTIHVHYMGVPYDRARAVGVQEFLENYPHLLQLSGQTALLHNPGKLYSLLQTKGIR